MSKSDKMTREEAFEIMDRHITESDIQMQEYAELMGNRKLAYYGKKILDEMEKNGESWNDVEDSCVRNNRPGAHPFYIWTANFVYFVSCISAGIGGPIFHIKSVPRNPKEGLIVMTAEELFENVDSPSIKSDIRRQQDVELMDNEVLVSGKKDILDGMQVNKESWDDVEGYNVYKHQSGENSFYIWTANFVYFASSVLGFDVKSIPRNPADDIIIIPKWFWMHTPDSGI